MCTDVCFFCFVFTFITFYFGLGATIQQCSGLKTLQQSTETTRFVQDQGDHVQCQGLNVDMEIKYLVHCTLVPDFFFLNVLKIYSVSCLIFFHSPNSRPISLIFFQTSSFDLLFICSCTRQVFSDLLQLLHVGQFLYSVSGLQEQLQCVCFFFRYFIFASLGFQKRNW